MSQHSQAQNAQPLNPNLVALVLIVSFIIIGGMIVSGLPTPSLRNAEGEAMVVAVQPTPLPTSTPAPTATPTAVPVTSTPQTVANAGASGGSVASGNYDPALVSQGQTLFALCAACHGPDALGLPNLGKNLVESEFVHSLTDEELMNFVKAGRPMWDALNTTGVDMPPKGGNPALKDEEILAIIAYIRSLSGG